MSPSGFKEALKFVGKKIAWMGWDEESEGYVIVFDDKTAIAVTDLNIMEDVSSFVNNTLDLKLTDAEQIITLKDMFAPKPKEAQDEPAGN